SIARLDEVGILHTGAGPNLTAARAPAVVERNGLRVGVLQRSSVYWPTDHEARDDAPGIAVLHGHTAYHVPMGRAHPGIPPANRPGIPPVINRWGAPGLLGGLLKGLRRVPPKGRLLGPPLPRGAGTRATTIYDRDRPRSHRRRRRCRRGSRPTLFAAGRAL